MAKAMPRALAGRGSVKLAANIVGALAVLSMAAGNRDCKGFAELRTLAPAAVRPRYRCERT